MGSYYRYSPCGQCCCSSDENRICICSCSMPFPRTATTGDDLGTHTLTIPTLGGTVWTAVHQVKNVTVCDQFLGCPCNTGIWEIWYRLFFDCSGTVGFPAGRWRFSVEAKIAVCFGFPNRGTNAGLTAFWAATDDADFTCNANEILTFNIPDALTNSFNPGLSYPNPGGGGLMTVVFG